MKINIYYGGRGVIGDPTIPVINKMQEVLKELNVTVERFDLYEMKNGITTLPQTLKNADGIILASTVEWYGIGGFMQRFLDACWLYGDKEKISQIYMLPVVMSTTYGEREGQSTLVTAWEILGGLPCSGICGYFPEVSMLESSQEYIRLIEKKAETLYRIINQKQPVMPCSNQVVKQKVSYTQNMNLTPQEAEQLSQYVSDDRYVQQQKEDIQELASMFKDLMSEKEVPKSNQYINELHKYFKPQPGFQATYKFMIKGNPKPLILKVDRMDVKAYYGDIDKADVEMQIEQSIMNDIISGHMTFQRAFMAGSMKMKGDFKVLRTLDLIYDFTA